MRSNFLPLGKHLVDSFKEPFLVVLEVKISHSLVVEVEVVPCLLRVEVVFRETEGEHGFFHSRGLQIESHEFEVLGVLDGSDVVVEFGLMLLDDEVHDLK